MPRARGRVSVEVLVKGDQPVPHGIGLELLVAAEHGSASLLIRNEEVDHPLAELVGEIAEGDLRTGASRVLDQEVVAEESGEPPHTFDHDEVHREPHRTAPVRVPAEQPSGRLAGVVADCVHHPAEVDRERLIAVRGRQGAHAMGREELILVEQPTQHASKSLR